MPSLSPELSAAVAARHGIVTRDDLLADGLTIDQVRRMVAARRIERCHDGVYRFTTSPETFESRCVAACAADPSIIVTGTAAGHLWGFRHVPRPTIPIVLVEHDRRPLSCGAIVRRSNVIDPEDVVIRADGIVVASPPRTWFDCARDVDDETFEAITEWVIDRHSTVPTLLRTFHRLEQRGRPGLARVRRVLSQRPTWQKPAGSRLELRVLNALRRIGVPALVRQLPLRLANGVVVHPDGADPAIRWALEIDHVTWHGGRRDAQRDKSRDRALRRIGWQVDRVTDSELATDFDATIRELAQLYALRAADLAP